MVVKNHLHSSSDVQEVVSSTISMMTQGLGYVKLILTTEDPQSLPIDIIIM
jgi:hypothetical protein